MPINGLFMAINKTIVKQMVPELQEGSLQKELERQKAMASAWADWFRRFWITYNSGSNFFFRCYDGIMFQHDERIKNVST